ncbi:MAG: hypothetical protein RL757_327 [Bacteroidota bacterium]
MFNDFATKSVSTTTISEKKEWLRNTENGFEMRGVWVSTIQNVDFPRQPTAKISDLKQQWLSELKFYDSLNINCVIVQVRPSADAIYPSQLVPFSKFISGKSGKNLEGNFDLLEFMIRTAHEKGMAFHAWVNPFRAVLDGDTTTLHPLHVFKAHRDWIFKYGREWMLNPGIPEVRDHFVAVVDEIVEKYDIDAIHFDDYFYPYRLPDENLGDAETFKTYGAGFDDINEWRRSNINDIMQRIHENTKNRKATCEIGVSPFSVWRNQKDDPRGSDTRAGQRCYDDLYADVLNWIDNDWIDYVAPQLYFHIGFELVDYEKIANWWIANRKNKQLYVGLAVYKVNNNKYVEWSQPDQILKQMTFNREHADAISGAMFFSSKWLHNNALGVTNAIRKQFFQNPAAVPILREEAGAPEPAAQNTEIEEKQ